MRAGISCRLPVVPASSQVSQLFPTAEAAFGYNGSYQEATTLASGSGYWIKVPASTTVSVSGTPVTSVSQSLVAGWNLVGAPNCTVTPTTTPSGNIEAIFGFNGTYYPAAQLTAGNGYWVKSTSNATLNAAWRRTRTSVALCRSLLRPRLPESLPYTLKERKLMAPVGPISLSASIRAARYCRSRRRCRSTRSR